MKESELIEKRLNKAKNYETKKMWEYANLEFKIIIIIGVITVIKWAYLFGSYIGKLIG